MADEAEQLKRKRRLMREEARRLTPQQRLGRMADLQNEYFAMLERNPEAYQRFLRRNYRKRAVHHDPGKAG